MINFVNNDFMRMAYQMGVIAKPREAQDAAVALFVKHPGNPYGVIQPSDYEYITGKPFPQQDK